MDLFEDFLAPAEEEENEIHTVSEATRKVKTLLETGLPLLWVEGEISNFKHHSSGHMYFSLKDDQAQMSCVMWAGRNASLPFRPGDGMKALVHGRITVYEKRGQYQLDVIQMQPAGMGALQLAFEQLKQRLREEGLFDSERKRPVPAFAQRIGIATSPSGAAIRDLVSVIRRRWPPAEIVLRPTQVQGREAAADIARAIAELNEYGEVDVIIIGRGGGSLEDLWAFNEERVARAIARSALPVVSAVGHEIDFTIADFVADLRAPTPSVAGEMVVPDAREVFARLNGLITGAYRILRSRIDHGEERLKRLRTSYGLRRPADVIHQYAQRIDDLQHRLQTTVGERLQKDLLRLRGLQGQLQALSVQRVLERGFTMTRESASGRILKEVAAVKAGVEMQIVFHDGIAERIYQHNKE